MNGRKLFSLVKPMVTLSTLIVSLFPRTIRQLLFDLFSMFPTKLGVLLRYITIRTLCESVGDNVYIGRGVILKNPSALNIGRNVSIHDYGYIDALGGILIEDNVSIAHRCSLVSFEHGYDEHDLPIKYNTLRTAPISISSDVWLGANVVVLSGSKIAMRSVIGAGSVVKGHLDGKSLYAGVPVKKIKSI